MHAPRGGAALYRTRREARPACISLVPRVLGFVCAGTYVVETVYLAVVILANAVTIYCWWVVKKRLRQAPVPPPAQARRGASRRHADKLKSYERFQLIHFAIVFGVALSPFWYDAP